MLMSCRQATRQVTDAREGALTAFARARYRLHLAMCPNCRAYVLGFEQVLSALRDLPATPPPAELYERLVDRLKARTSTEES